MVEVLRLRADLVAEPAVAREAWVREVRARQPRWDLPNSIPRRRLAVMAQPEQAVQVRGVSRAEWGRWVPRQRTVPGLPQVVEQVQGGRQARFVDMLKMIRRFPISHVPSTSRC